MAGIPVHTDSPISPNSPKTTAARPNTTTAEPIAIANAPPSVPATTTATMTSAYQPARPGAAAVPAPTSSAGISLPGNAVPTRTVPPPATTVEPSNNPAPPQPGQVPSPYAPSSHNTRPSIPPPPKAGELPNPSQNVATTTAVPSMPTQQFSAPPPHTTAAADLSHPPGYSQNVHESFEDRGPPAGSNPFGQASGGGILGNNTSSFLGDRERDVDGEDNSVWDTAAKMVKAAGKKLSEGEQQIWKMVNGADK